MFPASLRPPYFSLFAPHSIEFACWNFNLLPPPPPSYRRASSMSREKWGGGGREERGGWRQFRNRAVLSGLFFSVGRRGGRRKWRRFCTREKKERRHTPTHTPTPPTHTEQQLVSAMRWVLLLQLRDHFARYFSPKRSPAGRGHMIPFLRSRQKGLLSLSLLLLCPTAAGAAAQRYNVWPPHPRHCSDWFCEPDTLSWGGGVRSIWTQYWEWRQETGSLFCEFVQLADPTDWVEEFSSRGRQRNCDRWCKAFIVNHFPSR